MTNCCPRPEWNSGLPMPANKREIRAILSQYGQGNIDMDPCLLYLQGKLNDPNFPA